MNFKLKNADSKSAIQKDLNNYEEDMFTKEIYPIYSDACKKTAGRFLSEIKAENLSKETANMYIDYAVVMRRDSLETIFTNRVYYMLNQVMMQFFDCIQCVIPQEEESRNKALVLNAIQRRAMANGVMNRLKESSPVIDLCLMVKNFDNSGESSFTIMNVVQNYLFNIPAAISSIICRECGDIVMVEIGRSGGADQYYSGTELYNEVMEYLEIPLHLLNYKISIMISALQGELTEFYHNREICLSTLYDYDNEK